MTPRPADPPDPSTPAQPHASPSGITAGASCRAEPGPGAWCDGSTQNADEAMARLAFHIDNAPLGVIEWDAQWRIQRWSPMAERMFGWSADEVIGRRWDDWRFVCKDDMSRVERLMRGLVGDGKSTNVLVNRNHTKDGRLLTCAWFTSVMRGDRGEVVSFLSFAQDVTEHYRDRDELVARRRELQTLNDELEARVARRTAELTQTAADLRESERRYRMLAENATDMISCHSFDGRFTCVSPACRALLGCEPEDLIGELPRVIAHPDDRHLVIDSLHRLRQAVGVVRTTFRALKRDGSVVWLESSSHSQGEEIVVVSRDVTQRLDAEHRLRLIESAVDQVGEAVVITDADLHSPGPRIVYVNPAFTAMTGYSADEALGRSPRLLQGPRTRPEVLDRLRHALSAGKPFLGQNVNYRKDGSEYTVEWNINPLRDARQQITHWVAIQRDVTARNLALQMAQVHRAELAHVARLSTMGEMASGLAHEINQPLAAITNYTNGILKHLQKTPDPHPQISTALARIADQSERAAQIIRRIRAFVNKRGSVRAVHHLNDLIRETLSLLETDLQEHQTRVDLDLAQDLPPIHVDGIQIEQVLVNVIRNALEAMETLPSGQRTIRLTSTLEPTGHLRVTIHDHGSGLSESQRNHLFDPFFSTKEDGMGLGLTISQSIAQDHGGRLWATPDPQIGTRLHLTLPPSRV
ncbi:MAG: PAS domain S-box protein [Planctomycetota bacterium]